MGCGAIRRERGGAGKTVSRDGRRTSGGIGYGPLDPCVGIIGRAADRGITGEYRVPQAAFAAIPRRSARQDSRIVGLQR